MTSQQILKADLLDILFENRNKSYGAYEIRRTYNKQMLKALVFTVTPAVLILFFLNPAASSNTVEKEKERIVVVEQVVLPKKEKKPELPQAAVPAKPLQVKQQQFNSNLTMVKEVNNPLPTQEVLETAAVSNQTITEGENAATFQPALKNEPPAAKDNGVTEEATREIVPDRQPQFPGGMQAWLAFLSRHLQSPTELESGEKRTVLIRFHVAEDGSVANFTVLQSAGTNFDQEVMRVLKKMPKWTPAMQGGHAVPVSFTQPVTFVGLED